MKQPCLLDIKIGRRLYDVDATPIKIMKRLKKSQSSCSGHFGFRLCGIRYGNGVIFKKQQLMNLTSEEISAHLLHFLGSSPDLRGKIVEQLHEIRTTVMMCNTQLISTSILIAYDFSDFTTIRMKIIDFAHSHIHPIPFDDENYIEGLSSLIEFLELL